MFRAKAVILLASTFLLLTPCATHSEQSEFPVAKIYVADNILTMDQEDRIATAVAVADGKIIATGSLRELEQSLSGYQLRVDRKFEGRTLMPGFIDNHLHPALAGILLPARFITPWPWKLPSQEVEGVQGREPYLERLTEVLGAAEDQKAFLITWGYHQYFHGELVRSDLDAVSTITPIIVWHRSFHEIIVNTAALERLGMIEEEYEGHPMIDYAAGHFWETGLFEIFDKLAPIVLDPDRLESGMLEGLEHARQNGVTTLCDQGVPLLDLDSEMAMLESVIVENNLPLRMLLVGSGTTMAVGNDAEATLAAISALPKRDSATLTFLPKQVKLFADGAFYSQLMQMQGGYLDGHHGEWITKPDDLIRQGQHFWKEGFQIHVHVNGDEGVRVVLDMIEQLNREYPREDHKTVLHHFGYSAPNQTERLADLGISVSANPYYLWALGDKYAEVGLGPERAHAINRLGSLEKLGVSVSLHSDLPMAPAAPLVLASIAASRQSALGNVLMPSEKMSPLEALRGITINAAKQIQQEQLIGSIETGKRADFTVLEENPLDIDPVEWRNIVIWGTVFGGEERPR